MLIGPPKKPPPALDKPNQLAGKYDDFYANAKIYDQKFGLVLTADNLRNPAKISLSYGPDNYYPWRPFAALDRSQKRDKVKQQWLATQFAIHIDVQHFKPNEIRIKVTGRQCNVKASHRDRVDDHGFVARKFEREFALPKDIDVESVKSIISSDGVLTFKAVRTSAKSSTPSPGSEVQNESQNETQKGSGNETQGAASQGTAINVISERLKSLEEDGIEIPIQFVKEDEVLREKKDQ